MPYPFPGGTEVEEHKGHRERSSRQLPLPRHLRLPLPSADVTLAVTVGQRVLRGDVIATATVPLHAPTSGCITGICEASATVGLEADGDDTTRVAEFGADRHDPTDEAVLARIERGGVTGLGGGGYPAHRKLVAARARGVHTIVVNAVECEPWLTADEVLIRERTTDIGDGIAIVERLLPAARTVIAIDPRKHGAIAALTAAGHGDALLTTAPRFPAGAERMIFTALTGGRLRPDERPVQRGYVFFNAATLCAIGRAVLRGEPVTERLISIAGPCIAEPGTAWVRIGTPVGDALSAFGLTDFGGVDLLEGGPLTGKPIAAETGVDKTTLGIFADGRRRDTPTPCIRCGHCARACPEALAPQDLHFAATEALTGRLQSARLMDCIECGACEPVCPSHLPLLAEFRDAKGVAAEQARAAAMAARAQARFAAHEHRRSESARAAALRREQRLAQRLGGDPHVVEPR